MTRDPPRPEALGASRVAVQRFAERVGQAYDFDPGSPIESLVARLGGRIDYMGIESLFEDQDGSLFVHGPNDFEVRVSAVTGARRNRFTIAHELGHYFLHSENGRKRIVATRLGSDRAEWEANWFAAALLMPEAHFRSTCDRIGCDPERIAARYLVSSRAAEIRMRSLGIVDDSDR